MDNETRKSVATHIGVNHDHGDPPVEKHFRFVPEPGGPFRLEHMRQKGRWCPIDDAVGDLEAITEFMKTDMLDSSHVDALKEIPREEDTHVFAKK